MKLSLSENICRWRKECSLTQEQLAEALGVTFASVSKWERGVATPELSLIAKMADLFGVSFDALVGYKLQNGSMIALEERIHQLQREKKYDDAAAEAEKALIRYPNDFRIVYRCGEMYALGGIERGNAKYLHRCIELLERSVLLISQNTDPVISEASIKAEIAQCHIVLGNHTKGVEILKAYNICGVHNPLIAVALTGNDAIGTNIKASGLDDAVPFMEGAFVSILSNSIRTMLAYANYYCRKSDYFASREALLWLIDLLERVKADPDSPCYVDKVMAPCYSGCAACSLLLGETEKAELYMRRAYQTAILFDSAPVHQAANIKFCIGDIQNTTTYDDLGESATAAVIKQLTQETAPEQLLNMWNRVANKETRGGAR